MRFYKGISYAELNPYNFALKNDYVQNLIYSGQSLFSSIKKIVGNSNIKVTRGFLSRRYLHDILPKINNSDERKLVAFHSVGLAISVKLEDFSFALDIAKECHNYNDCAVIMEEKHNLMSFYFQHEIMGIFQKVDGSLRLVEK